MFIILKKGKGFKKWTMNQSCLRLWIMTKRLFDLILSIVIAGMLIIPFLLICLAVKLTSKGPVFHLSKRIGKNNRIFLMPKFRSMLVDSPQVATHLLKNPSKYLTPIGGFLRKSSLDELPQLLSILQGHMSFVGPRPALFNQDDLKDLRTQCNVHTLTPGITGWAQVNGRDELPIPIKVQFDEYYLKHQSVFLDLKIILLTAYKVFKSEGVSH
jgi:O-antigen biosynthesis protein WbqP